MILASAVCTDFSGKVADLGAGAGAAGLAVAARCKKTRVVLVENMPEMILCVEKTLQDPRNAGLAERIGLLAIDLQWSGQEREKHGLMNGSFDCVIMNPPFTADSGTKSPYPLKRAAHMMSPHLPEIWLRCAAAITKQKAEIAFIIRPQALANFLNAMDGRFGGAMIMPVYTRKERPAIRVIVKAFRGLRASLSLLPPLVLHKEKGHQLTTKAHAITNGLQGLFCA